MVSAAAVFAILAPSHAYANALRHESQRAVFAGVTIDLGKTSRLFVIKVTMSGPLGKFVVFCSRNGTPRSQFTITSRAPSTIAAVDGRGVSRSGQLASERRTLGGGSGEELSTGSSKPQTSRKKLLSTHRYTP